MPPAQQRSVSGEHETAIQWLKDNYQECSAIPIDNSNIMGVPRASIYERYQQQYSRQRTAVQLPVNSATFGKLVRSVFPNIRTRRLGNRGQSKYYYCGIIEVNPSPLPVAATSEGEAPIFDRDEMMNIDTDNEQQNIGLSAQQPQQQPQQSSVQDSIEDTLPPFTISPMSFLHDNISTDIIAIYHRHCKQLLHLINTNQNVREAIITFYDTLPRDMLELIQSDADMIETLCNWDCIFYDVIISYYYPTIDAEVDMSIIPLRLSEWSSTLKEVVPIALKQGFPQEFIDNKLAVAKIFSSKLERIMHLNFLAQVSNQVLREHSNSMLDLWRRIDHQKISDRTEWIAGNKGLDIAVLVTSLFERPTLDENSDTSHPQQSIIRYWIDTMDSMMNNHLSNGQSYNHIKKLAVIWSAYTSIARREMELQNKSQSNSVIIDYFERLWVFTNDYIHYLTEQEIAKRNAEMLLICDRYDEYSSQQPTPLPPYSVDSGPSPDYMSTTTATPQTMSSFLGENHPSS
ncbi:RFX DNA-binding domain-containing protein [Phascolomyces articulosus]|uniref:RFX DNA-binding domain-containing protein n=1 Tax=Phascolomyces articulosus TaxID=60185 RepID=A0AAD5JPV1_9FUNG|nr:RFX DNA-binding domain-containing protein [Phascolomyces articulosus]